MMIVCIADGEEDVPSKNHHLDTVTQSSIGDFDHEKKAEETTICQTKKEVNDPHVTVELMSDNVGSCTVEFGTIEDRHACIEDGQKIENSIDTEDCKEQLQTSFTEPDPFLQGISKDENYISEKCEDLMENDMGVADKEPNEQEKSQGQGTSMIVEKEAAETYDASAGSCLSAFYTSNDNGNGNESISKEENEKEMSLLTADYKQEDETTEWESIKNSHTITDDANVVVADVNDTARMQFGEGQNPMGAENDIIEGYTHDITEANNFQTDAEIDEENHRRKKIENMYEDETLSTLFVSLLKSEELCVQGSEFGKYLNYSHEQCILRDRDEGSKRDEICCDSALMSNSAKAEMNGQSNTGVYDDTIYSDTDDKCTREIYETESFQMNRKIIEREMGINEQHRNQKRVLSVPPSHPLAEEQMQYKGVEPDTALPFLKEGEQQGLMEKQDETNICSADVPTIAQWNHEDMENDTLLTKRQKNSDSHRSEEDEKDPELRSEELTANENIDHGFPESPFRIQNYQLEIVSEFDDHPLSKCSDNDLCHHGASHFISKNKKSLDVQESAHVDDTKDASFESIGDQFLGNQQQHDASISARNSSYSNNPNQDAKDSPKVSDGVARDGEVFSSTSVQTSARKIAYNNPEQAAASEINMKDAYEFKGEHSNTLQLVPSEPSSPVEGLRLQSSPDPAMSTVNKTDIDKEDNRANAGIGDECKNSRTMNRASQQESAMVPKLSTRSNHDVKKKPKRRRWIQCICCACDS